jgi:predicted PurR-regulated permease PerM
MALDTTSTAQKKASPEPDQSGHARRRRLLTALTALAFLAIGWAALYAMSLITGAITLLFFSALLAYLIFPLVEFFQRRLKRALAIALAYVLIAVLLAAALFLATSPLLQQIAALKQYVQFLLGPGGKAWLQSITNVVGTFGIGKDQVTQLQNQLLSQVQGVLSGLLPFLNGLIGNVISLIVIITLSVYFVVDGPRIIHWLRFSTPVRSQDTIAFLL